MLITNYFFQSRSKKEDYRRQDEVAARLLLANSKTNGKLDIIHTLVNSNMTAAIQGEYDGSKREVILLEQLIKNEQEDGKEPPTDLLAATDAAKQKIVKLGSALEDREKQAGIVAAQEIVLDAQQNR
jgi:hypothetical protein